MVPKMGYTDAQIGPEVHRDDIVSGLIIMARWHGALAGAGRKPIGIRELSRKLDLSL